LSHSPPPANVTVTVPARLHLGFLDLNGGLGRRFGGIGLSINGLRTSITISAASHMRVTGPENKRVHGYLQTMQRALDSDSACHVTINEVVPAHAGLGWNMGGVQPSHRAARESSGGNARVDAGRG